MQADSLPAEPPGPQRGQCLFWQLRLGPASGRTVTPRSAALITDSPAAGLPCSGCPPLAPLTSPLSHTGCQEAKNPRIRALPQPLPLAFCPAGSSRGPLLVAQTVKNPPANAGDLGSILGLKRSAGEGNGNPLQYSFLENPMKRGAWQVNVHGVAESDTT